MTTAVFIIFDATERAAAMELNGPEHRVDPRLVDAANPPGGANVNEAASGRDLGDSVSAIGKYATTANIVNDPAYLANTPGMIDYLNTLPWIVVDGDMLFLQPPPEG